MKNIKKNLGVTLLALIVTIIVMLILILVSMQMTIGKNGIIEKANKAKIEEEKAELLEKVKVCCICSSIKGMEKGKKEKNPEKILSSEDFKSKYNIVGDNITDKEGHIIETKKHIIDEIKNITSEQSEKNEENNFPCQSEKCPKVATINDCSRNLWPKHVGGVEIVEDDKDKLILKLIVKNQKSSILFGQKNDPKYEYIYCNYNGEDRLKNISPTNIDFGNGEKGKLKNVFDCTSKDYLNGEYILKFENVQDFAISPMDGSDIDVEILQWGKIISSNEDNYISIHNVSEIYEPEPDKIPITYSNFKFYEIPEWIFNKKVTSKMMSRFMYSPQIKRIPEGLFKNCINVEKFMFTFNECYQITEIPEKLFENNTKVFWFHETFWNTGITKIPENLFKNNTKAWVFNGTFALTKIKEIPEDLFKYNLNIEIFEDVFRSTNIEKIPKNIFKYNKYVITFRAAFYNCQKIEEIPEGLFDHNEHVRNFDRVFENCINLKKIPGTLFNNKKEIDQLGLVFRNCISLEEIPENLFDNNKVAFYYLLMFSNCKNLKYIQQKILQHLSSVGIYGSIYPGCTSASNYDSIPEDLKKPEESVEEDHNRDLTINFKDGSYIILKDRGKSFIMRT